MGFLHGRRALIAGMGSNRPIARGLARPIHRDGTQRADFDIDHQISSCSIQALGKVGRRMFRGAGLPVFFNGPGPIHPENLRSVTRASVLEMPTLI